MGFWDKVKDFLGIQPQKPPPRKPPFKPENPPEEMPWRLRRKHPDLNVPEWRMYVGPPMNQMSDHAAAAFDLSTDGRAWDDFEAVTLYWLAFVDDDDMTRARRQEHRDNFFQYMEREYGLFPREFLWNVWKEWYLGAAA